VYQLVFYFLVMEASLLGLGLDASLPLETAKEALWKVLWKAGGKKKGKSERIKRTIFD
jgi:hypothetical protein